MKPTHFFMMTPLVMFAVALAAQHTQAAMTPHRVDLKRRTVISNCFRGDWVCEVTDAPRVAYAKF